MTLPKSLNLEKSEFNIDFQKYLIPYSNLHLVKTHIPCYRPSFKYTPKYTPEKSKRIGSPSILHSISVMVLTVPVIITFYVFLQIQEFFQKNIFSKNQKSKLELFLGFAWIWECTKLSIFPRRFLGIVCFSISKCSNELISHSILTQTL